MAPSPAKRLVQIACCVFFNVMCAGVIFGFASLKKVMVHENVYSSLCPTPLNDTMTSNGTTATNGTIYPIISNIVLNATTSCVCSTNATDIITMDNSTTALCIAQDQKMNFLFTSSATVTNVAALPIGIFLDRFGPKVTALVGATFFAIGTSVFPIGLEGAFDTYYLGYILIALGSPMIFLSSFFLQHSFPKRRGLILSFVTGAFDASALWYLIYQVVYEYAGRVPLGPFFWAYNLIPVTIWIYQIGLGPRKAYDQNKFVKSANQGLPGSSTNKGEKTDEVNASGRDLGGRTKTLRRVTRDPNHEVGSSSTSPEKEKERDEGEGEEMNDVTTNEQWDDIPMKESDSDSDPDGDDDVEKGGSNILESIKKTPGRVVSSAQALQNKGVQGVATDTSAEAKTWLLEAWELRKPIFSSWFFAITFFFCVTGLRFNFVIQTINTQLPWFISDADLAATLEFVFTILLPLGGLVAVVPVGMLLDKYPPLTSSNILLIGGLVMGIFSIIPGAISQVLMMVIFVLLRPMLYTYVASLCFSDKVFAKHNATLYGLANAISGVFGLLSKPMIEAVQGPWGGNYTWINIILLGVGLLSSVMLSSQIKYQDWTKTLKARLNKLRRRLPGGQGKTVAPTTQDERKD